MTGAGEGQEPQDFGVLLSLAQATFATELVASLQAEGYDGFSTRTGFVLRLLVEEPLGLRRLAERLRMTPQATLKLVDTMADQGYVDRTPSAEDGRVRLISVSGHGRAALAAASAFHDRFEAELASVAGADAVAATRAALALLAERGPVVVPTAHVGLRRD